MTTSIRGILSGIQIDVGMALYDQASQGGNAGLKSLAIGGLFTLYSPMFYTMAGNLVEMIGDTIFTLKASVGKAFGKLFKRFGRSVSKRLKHLLNDYWNLGGGIPKQQAKEIAKQFGFDFGTASRLQGSRFKKLSWLWRKSHD